MCTEKWRQQKQYPVLESGHKGGNRYNERAAHTEPFAGAKMHGRKSKNLLWKDSRSCIVPHKSLSSHKSLQNSPVIPNHKTVMFLYCYMNPKSPEQQMSPSCEILRSITERKGGTLEATGNFYSSWTWFNGYTVLPSLEDDKWPTEVK